MSVAAPAGQEREREREILDPREFGLPRPLFLERETDDVLARTVRPDAFVIFPVGVPRTLKIMVSW